MEPKKKMRHWTDNEEQRLAKLLKENIRSDVAKILGRSIKSIEKKMVELKLRSIIKQPNNFDFFRADEDQFIKNNFQTMSNENLALRLQRSTNAIGHRLSRLNLVRDDVKYLRKQIKCPCESTDLAWFIGAIASDGWTDKDGYVAMDVIDVEYRDEFAKKGAELFSIMPSFPVSRKRDENKEQHRVVFASREMVDFFGDMREVCWAITFYKKHSWILQKSEYIQAFLSAYFDGDGSVAKQWNIGCIHESSSILLKSMLDQLNIRTRYYFYKNAHAKLIIEDKIAFAEQIKLTIPRKQLKLNSVLQEG